MIKIDDSYSILTSNLRGRKPKFKFQKDSEVFIYKYGAMNNEIWAELIAEQLGLQVGIEMAHYEIASYDDTIGVLTPSFLKPNELIISSDNLKLNILNIYQENNIFANLSNNTIVNIVRSACLHDPRVKVKSLTLELMLRWCFYGLIMESDKNETNIAFIRGKNALRLTPDFDNSSMCCLNKNISNIMDSLKSGYNIYTLTDSIKTNLRINDDDTGFFLQDFENFAKKYPIQCDYCMEKLSQINLEEVFNNVEKINNTEIPWEIKYWVSKLIQSRYNDMLNIYNRSKEYINSSKNTLKKVNKC